MSTHTSLELSQLGQDIQKSLTSNPQNQPGLLTKSVHVDCDVLESLRQEKHLTDDQFTQLMGSAQNSNATIHMPKTWFENLSYAGTAISIIAATATTGGNKAAALAVITGTAGAVIGWAVRPGQ